MKMFRKRYKILTVLAMSVMLNGCSLWVGAVLGIGAAAGYVIGKDKRSLSQIGKDQNISASINSSLYREANVNPMAIKVYSYENNVILEGTAPSQSVVNRIGQIANNTRGVNHVSNQIHVDSPYS